LVVETYLIRLRDDISDADKRNIIRAINGVGGRIESILKNDSVLIASIDNEFVDLFRGHPLVTLIGGVAFRGRKIRKTTFRKS
jgi:hypothetical protein